jgi:hypothetical protein
VGFKLYGRLSEPFTGDAPLGLRGNSMENLSVKFTGDLILIPAQYTHDKIQ